MIEFIDVCKTDPYQHFIKLYNEAKNQSQEHIEAAAVSTASHNKKPSSRFVNIKYVHNESFIFFSNYNSVKAKDIESNPQASILFFWSKTNTQIRLEGKIIKTSNSFSDDHFQRRSYEKNISAIISNQSSENDGYSNLIQRYEKAIKAYKGKDLARPTSWGGYSFVPKSFEFWQGENARLNKRLKFSIKENIWSSRYLDP